MILNDFVLVLAVYRTFSSKNITVESPTSEIGTHYRVYFRILLQGGQMLRVQILEGASINITTYFKEQQTKF